jgi:hypothetical protein
LNVLHCRQVSKTESEHAVDRQTLWMSGISARCRLEGIGEVRVALSHSTRVRNVSKVGSQFKSFLFKVSLTEHAGLRHCDRVVGSNHGLPIFARISSSLDAGVAPECPHRFASGRGRTPEEPRAEHGSHACDNDGATENRRDQPVSRGSWDDFDGPAWLSIAPTRRAGSSSGR